MVQALIVKGEEEKGLKHWPKERAFMKNCKPTSEEIKMIGDTLSMDKEVVRVWFCNR
jgi:hypothetical protein